MRINFTRVLITRLAALALITACGFQVPAQVATTDRSVRLVSGLISGIANGQSIHATLANLVPMGANNPDAITFNAILTLYDERGSVVAQSERAADPARQVSLVRYKSRGDSLPGGRKDWSRSSIRGAEVVCQWVGRG